MKHNKKNVALSYPKQDFVRNKVAINSTNAVKNTPNVPVTPLPCSGAFNVMFLDLEKQKL